MEIHKKLSILRKDSGLTQLELAEALNVSRQAVSRWEVGTAVPSLDNLMALSRLYGVPLDYLVNEAAEKPQKELEESVCPGAKSRSLVRRAALALCLIAVGVLIATAVFTLHRDYQLRKAMEHTVIVDTDGFRIITDNPERFQSPPDEPRSYRMKPDGTYEEYTLLDEYRSMLDRLK